MGPNFSGVRVLKTREGNRGRKGIIIKRNREVQLIRRDLGVGKSLKNVYGKSCGGKKH